MVKELEFPYDMERIRPKLRSVFFGANPLTYLCVFFMFMLIAVLVRIPLLMQKAVAAFLLALDLIVVGHFISGLLKEYSRRAIAKKKHVVKISSERIELYVPTYNPRKFVQRTIRPKELEAIGLFFASKKKVGDMVFYFKDRSELEFDGGQLDMGTYNLEVVLKDAGYPTRRYRPKA
jgi:hypothetical protein